ncbi:histone deacetylase family protein [Uliginosibacterium sp. H1]|uniref:histone deacetylase family protein n=1 Tax=Uliginosibacterium sp. H1 TaxID=3114757 RepID=UPI002E18F310|nr:histone deacetylase [Uliginosibacterium sp. H1]
MNLYYAEQFVLPLPAGHRFPMAKYRLLREALIHSKLFSDKDFHVPPAATDTQIMRTHTAAYLQRAVDGALDPDEIRRIGFPWTPQMIERSRRSSGATIEAARSALRDGCAANLAGGTHHAHADFGSGFCVFNDAAIAARAMQAEEGIGRVAIIDCDVHQGDGTAAILAGDASVFTFSMHGAKNFPFRKQLSDLDIELPDGTEDVAYLAALEGGLDEVFSRSQPELVIYLAGADPFEGDRLGRLSLSFEGLRRRDDMVLAACQSRGVAVVIAMAGGYAENIADTVAIHAATITLARQRFA